MSNTSILISGLDLKKLTGRPVPAHIEYRKRQSFEYYKGGPFADRTGGLITFSAADMEEAEKVVSQDPCLAEGVLDHFIVKEWIPE